MNLPKYLIADNSKFPDKIYVIHCEYPRFILDVETDDIEWMDPLEKEQDVDLESEIKNLLDSAFEFFDREMNSEEN